MGGAFGIYRPTAPHIVKPMRCPTLAELPPPTLRKNRLALDGRKPAASRHFAGRQTLARISIVTPGYNQGQFIEETIRSVLLQGYPDLEYIVMDGRSVDDSRFQD